MRLTEHLPSQEPFRRGYSELRSNTSVGLSQRTEMAWWMAILMLVALTRASFVLINDVQILPKTDEAGYALIGSHFWDWIANGNAVRGPGYPALLAIFDADPQSVAISQICIEVISLALLMYLVRSLWGSLAARLTGIAWLTYLPFAYHDFLLLTETLTTLLVVAMGVILALLWNDRIRYPLLGFALAGALIGSIELVRPGSRLIFLIAVAIVLGWRYRPWRQVAIYGSVGALACVVVLTPWLYRNHDTYGELITTSITSHALLVGTVPEDFVSRGLAPSLRKLGYRYPYREYINDRTGLYARTDLARSNYERKVMWSFLKHHSNDYAGPIVKEHLKRPLKFWLRSSVGKGENAVAKPIRGNRLLPGIRAWHAALVFLAIVILIASPTLRRDSFPWLLMLTLATIASIFPQASSRYNLPFMPFVLSWVGVGAAALYLGLKRGNHQCPSHALPSQKN